MSLLFSGESEVNYISLNPDKTKIVCGYNNGHIIVYDLENYRHLITIKENIQSKKSSIYYVKYTPDNKYIISVNYFNCTISMYSNTDYSLIFKKSSLENYTSLDIHIDSNKFIVGTKSGRIYRFNINNNTFIEESYTNCSTNSKKTTIRCLCYSPCGNFYASASYNKNVILWSIDNEIINVFENHTNDVNTVSFSPDSNNLITGSDDSNIIIYDLKKNEIINILNYGSNIIMTAIYSDYGSKIFTCSFDNIIIWNSFSYEKDLIIDNPTKEKNIMTLLYNARNNTIIYAGDDKNIYFNDISEFLIHECLITFPLITNKILNQSYNIYYIEILLSNYNDFSTYLIKNNLLDKVSGFNGHNELLKYLSKYNLWKNNLSEFLHTIIFFIKGINHENYINPNYNNIILKYLDLIYAYLVYLNNFYKRKFSFAEIIDIQINRRIILELDYMIDKIKDLKKSSIYFNKKFRIKYINENGYNAGGLGREFFSNIEKQINDISYEEKFRNKIEKDIKTIILLGISKKNNCPIYLYNIIHDNLKKYIIMIISNSNVVEQSGSTTNIYMLKKNICEKLLLNDGKLKNSISFLLYGNNNAENIDKILTLQNKPENFNIFISEKYISNNNYSNKLGINTNIRYNNTNQYNLNNINSHIRKTIDALILNNTYIDYIDFFVSHFVEVKIDIDRFISNLLFENNSNLSELFLEDFKLKFKKLLIKLNKEELKSLNYLLSGSYRLQDNYIINIERIKIGNKYNNRDKLPIYHTCFNKIDIIYDSFLKNYLVTNSSNNITEESKNKFIQSINITMNSGFGIA